MSNPRNIISVDLPRHIVTIPGQNGRDRTAALLDVRLAPPLSEFAQIVSLSIDVIEANLDDITDTKERASDESLMHCHCKKSWLCILKTNARMIRSWQPVSVRIKLTLPITMTKLGQDLILEMRSRDFGR